MGIPVAKPFVSIEEYLRREAASEVRHEYHEGEVLAMSGGTYEHSLIGSNVIGEFRNRLKGSPCRVLESNMRVHDSPRYVYPDVTVVCGPPQFDPNDLKRTTIINPRVIIEVLSESTEAYDRGEKFEKYRTIASFEEYVLISQSKPSIETLIRQNDGTWLFAAWSGTEAVARIRTLKIDLPLSEIYTDVTFFPVAPPEGVEFTDE